jgi:hypothetical protein
LQQFLEATILAIEAGKETAASKSVTVHQPFRKQLA